MSKMRGGHRRKKSVSRALSLVLCAALLVSGYSTPVYAETTEPTGEENTTVVGTVSTGDVTVVSDDTVSTGDVTGTDKPNDTVSSELLQKEAMARMSLVASVSEGTYEQFTEDEPVAFFSFGEDVTAENIYSEETGFGFSDVEYNNVATGWSGNIYYPREISKNASGVGYVTSATDCLAIESKVWTETESTGYGVYTYENTSSFDMKLAPADYKVEVTLVNPTGNAYNAYLEAEDITKVTDITVGAGEEKTVSYTAVLVDGILNLKFLVSSLATTAEEAGLQTAYVSAVSVTRLATNEAASKPTIFIASDSTVQTYEKNYYPQTGWGQTLSLFFGDQVEERECEDCNFSQAQTYEAANVIVENRAIGGRSSKSYIEEGKLDDLLEDIKPGDYLFVQWGHNDATAARPNRYVSSADFEKWIQYYVDGALQRGATPVLVTPVARYSYVENADGTVTFVGNFEAYGNVMRQMAAQQDIPLVDLTARSVALCNSFGKEGAKSLFLHVAAGEYPDGAYAGGATDSTHLQYYGAYKFAQCVAQGILESSSAALADLKTKVVMNVPATVPGTITNLESTTVGASSVSMKWNADADSELYYIYRQELPDGMTAEDVDFSSANKYSVSSINKYTDNGCEAGVTYVYAVRGFNEKGLGEFSDKITVTTKSAGQKFDFNYNNSPTLEGWIGVNHNQMYDAANGYGWITAPGNGRYRSGNGNADSSDMADDFCLGAGEFAVDLPNGDYEVTVYAADLLPGTSTIKPSYTAEGLALGGISCKQALGSCTGTVRVLDGQLNLVVGGTNQYINGMTITELLKAPTGLAYSEMTIDGDTGIASFLLGFNPVDEAAGYRVYAKNSSDKDFSVVKSFTTAEYAADDLACRAMVGEAGEVYNFYITCVTADGTESAPSNTIEVSMIMAGDKAAAPANLVCTSPTKDTTQLQKSISLKWDAVSGAFKYIIYRSAKAEDEKGFVAFEKVGESKSTTFTDTNDVATNISYYYKVAAMTKTGIGELSEVCKTPVTGTLVAGGTEKYTDRGLVAINLAGSDGGEVNVTATDKNGNELAKGVYLSWRSFESDFDAKNNLTTTFTIYCNGAVIASNLKVTNLVYEGGKVGDTYQVVGSNDSTIGVNAVDTAVWANKYLELSLYCPDDATMPDSTTCNYSANDMSVGDLDGDGELELIVKWYPSNAKDNSGSGYTGKTYLDGYDVNFATGEVSLLWRIDMGVNIRSGAHYTQFQVWDYDGDGKAEIAVKTADGTTTYRSVDGTVAGLVETDYVGACNSAALPENTVSKENDYRNGSGYVLDGPEYFSVFNGEDGSKAAADVAYTPARGSVSAWGDAYGNRVDRFLSATAYLDGETPFAVFARGYYTRTCLTAYYLKDTDGDGVGDTIDTYWAFDTDKAGTQYEAQGNHGIGVNDIDNDGRDEIIYGALVIDHDGTVKYCTGMGHGDAMHISDWVSWNDGLEIMCVHEHDNAAYHVEVHDAETGEILMGYYTGKDTGRGVAADIDPTAEGAEWWSIASPTYESNDEPEWDSTDGEVYSSWSTLDNLVKLSNSTPASNFSIFWDGDLLSEVQDHTFNKAAYAPTGVTISKWNYETEAQDKLLYSTEIWSSNGTKGNLGLVADILGDWREEIIARTATDKNKVRIYSTTIETDYVVPCLLENLAYREAVAWQNVGYNQPANTSYLLSEGLVTAQLSEGEITSKTAEIQFTPANDGDLYGHDITAYEIYRAEGNGTFEKIDTVAVEDLDKVISGEGSSDGTTEETVDPVYLKFDFGVGNVKDGWTQVLSDVAYSEDLGYGFASTDGLSVKAYSLSDDADLADIYNDCVLGWITNGSVEFKVNVPDGTYDVTYYLGNGSGYVYNKLTAEGTDITDVRRGNTAKEGSAHTITVEVTDGVLNIVNTVSKSGMAAMYFSGLEIKDVTYDAWLAEKEKEETDEPEAPKTEIKLEELFAEDFEDGTKAFSLIAESCAANEYLEADTSTVNKNTSSYVYGVGARSGGDTGTQLTAALGIEENVTVAFDLKMDACMSGKSSNYSLLGAKNTINWLNSGSQILTITATANGNGYWGSITVNGQDITEKAKVSNGTANGESSGKGGLNRDTTGWMRVQAGLDFENQTVDVTITRIADNSVIYEGEVAFVNEVSALEYIYMAAGKQYGGVFTDNIRITKETEVVVEENGEGEGNGNTLYTYTDTNLKGNTSYTYKIAAVVDGKTSHMSRPLTVETAIEIAEVKDIVLNDIVEGTPLEEGKTVADLLPAKVKVVDTDGNEMDSDVTWDVSEVDINTVGTYKVYAQIKGQSTRMELSLNVIANEVKGVQPVEDFLMIVNTALNLPETVVVEYTNTTTKSAAVTWNTDNLDTNKVGEYKLTGSVDGYDDLLAEITVKVKENYVVSVEDINVEIAINTKKIAKELPKKVSAVMADGTTEDVKVEWQVEDVDTSAIGKVDIVGEIKDFADGVIAHVSIVYPVVARFDFGISKFAEADGWIGVTVNAKGGSKTMEELDVHYTEARGYGFLDASAKIDGRHEDYTYVGILPKNVYQDFALPAGNTFVYDVENGTYQVEVVSGSGYKSDVKSNVEGVACNPANSAGTYTIGSVTVEVEDGQLTIEFPTGRTSRVDAVIVRKVEAGGTTEGDEALTEAIEDLKEAVDELKEVESVAEAVAIVEEIVSTAVEVVTDYADNISLDAITDTLAMMEQQILEKLEELGSTVVKVEAPEGVEVENALFSADFDSQDTIFVSVKDEKTTAPANLSDDLSLEHAVYYNITMYRQSAADGELTKIQNKVPLRLTFPCPESLQGKEVVVIHVTNEETGEYEVLYPVADTATGNITVITKSLSPFIIVEKVVSNTNQSAGSSDNGSNSNVDDSDTSNVITTIGNKVSDIISNIISAITGGKKEKNKDEKIAGNSQGSVSGKTESSLDKQGVQDSNQSKTKPVNEKISEEAAPAAASANAEAGGWNLNLLIAIAAVVVIGFVGFGFFYGRKKEEE